MTIDHTTGNYYLLISCPNDVWRLMCSLVPKEKTGSTLGLSIVPKRCVQKYRTESKLSEDRRRKAFPRELQVVFRAFGLSSPVF